MEHVVVVGGGLAGHRALVALRSFPGHVTLIGDEPHRPYDRPPLSKQVLLGDMRPEQTQLACDDLDVEWRLADAAVALDTGRRIVRLAGGEEIGYDGLVIATGRRARALPGLPALDGFHVIRSLDDAVRFRAAAAGARRVVIVGAGFVGCEVAATLRARGVAVTVVDVAATPMATIGAAAGAFACRMHEERGVEFRLGSGVADFDGARGRVAAVTLATGERLPADLVLLALGSEPNSEWLRGSGVSLRDGNVVCDAHCAVPGAEGVVAAGDIATWPHPHGPGPDGLVCIEHWSTSREMARRAVENLLAPSAQRVRFATVPTFWSDQYDVRIKSAGLLTCATGFEVVEADPAHRRLVVEARRGDDLVGAVVFNRNKAFTAYHRRLRDALDPAVPVAA